MCAFDGIKILSASCSVLGVDMFYDQVFVTGNRSQTTEQILNTGPVICITWYTGSHILEHGSTVSRDINGKYGEMERVEGDFSSSQSVLFDPFPSLCLFFLSLC